MALRIVFMGTPDFAVPVLEAVGAAGHQVVAVYTQPPRPAGRGMADTKSPVQQLAESKGLAVFTPVNFKSDADQRAFAAHKADAAVVVAYGLILPETVLNAPKFGCFNVHASRLPRWRGAAPIQRAIMAGDDLTAVMVMRMEKGLDTGPICLSREIAIPPEMTAGELHDALSVAGAKAMVEALELLEHGALKMTPQSEAGVTYAAKIGKGETRIDFTRPAAEVVNHVRGLSPYPGAWMEVGAGGKADRLKILRCVVAKGSGAAGTVIDSAFTIACGSGAVRLIEVQRAGKRPITVDEFLRGFRLEPGTLVG